MRIGRQIGSGQYRVHYQPRFSIASGTCVSAEALVRIAGHSHQSPFHHIQKMEEDGTIEDLTMFVVDKVCRDINHIELLHGSCPKISINISPCLFRDESFVTRLQDRISLHRTTPSHIEFEITESLVIHDFDATITSAAGLRAAGFDLAIDDFGTGASGLYYLDLLPVSIIKIDQHFISGIGSRKSSEHIVAGAIRLAREMGLLSVSEGVETLEQMSYIVDQGCDEAQGFLLAHPMPFHEFVSFVEQHRQRDIKDYESWRAAD